MSFGVVASIAGPLIGGMMQSGAASDAANQQAQSGRESNALNQAQFEQTRADNAPTRARGNAAGSRLQMLMGLEGEPRQTRAGLRDKLRGQYTTGATPGGYGSAPGGTGLMPRP